MERTGIAVARELEKQYRMSEQTENFHDEIQTCLRILKEGGVIVYPTDTIWGIGCDATNEKAVERIYQIKKRVESKSLIVLLDDATKLNRYVRDLPEVAWDLLDNSDNPITIVYSGVLNLAKNVLAADGTAGIRVTKDLFCKQLIHKFGKPIVSTSANISGKHFDGRFESIESEVLDASDYVVGVHRNRPIGKPSTIIRLESGGKFEIIRP